MTDEINDQLTQQMLAAVQAVLTVTGLLDDDYQFDIDVEVRGGKIATYAAQITLQAGDREWKNLSPETINLDPSSRVVDLERRLAEIDRLISNEGPDCEGLPYAIAQVIKRPIGAGGPSG